MSRMVMILGAGGHARVLADVLRLQGSRLVGMTSNDDDVLGRYSPEEIDLVNGVGSIGVPLKRRELFERFKSRGYRFTSVIHPSAILGSDVSLGEGVQIMAGVIIQPGTALGDNTLLNTRVSVDHDCVIGSHVHLAPGVILCGGVTVEEGCHVGTGAVVVQGVRIGKNTFVRARKLVSPSKKPVTP